MSALIISFYPCGRCKNFLNKNMSKSFCLVQEDVRFAADRITTKKKEDFCFEMGVNLMEQLNA